MDLLSLCKYYFSTEYCIVNLRYKALDTLMGHNIGCKMKLAKKVRYINKFEKKIQGVELQQPNQTQKYSRTL